METNHHNMGGAPPPPSWFNATHPHHKTTLMHMTFYWGKRVQVLFTGWPGNSTAMYALALTFVFALAVIVEWLSQCNLIKPGANRVAAGFFQTGVHTIRGAIAYLVMLAVMSYNGGVFLAAVLGHAVGFAVFGSGVFFKGKP
ncbi:copper transporter 1-like [Camellia sinensis]|uniref:Copper transport protein n=1 Tax=Camellia sinensis var. sinensis TaxID=542762 RepID=A0A4S4DW77_CAMSN|nr:copper transporter 1-like [Camellia sinensis]THG07612.1 hypothetical protein TEA_022957 [Camellia sinensis var. sinensis]